ncbi:hypothetical protein PG993_009081 [Apiospora rasikravindrae]|uniref:Uncharacterized protein n=1 Tax=Apiospora rasikravindrae TaxID=990691 RepID=A0ABR1SJQ1_9PEZI
MAPSSSFTFETPSPSNTRGTRTRPRNPDPVAASPDDAGSKGGRSLRKRTRIDYSFDQVDDAVEQATASKATPTTTRSLKKRKTDLPLSGDVFDDESEPRVKRRASEQPAKSANRRAQPRKTTLDPQPFVADQLEEDVPVQDTIEVGGHHSEVSDESFHQRTNSGSSHTGSAGPLSHMIHEEEEEAQEKPEDAPVSNPAHTILPSETKVDTKAKPAPEPTSQTAELHLPKIEAEEPPDVQVQDVGAPVSVSEEKAEGKPQEILEEEPATGPAETSDEKREEKLEERPEMIEKAQEKPEEKSKERQQETPEEVLEDKPIVKLVEQTSETSAEVPAEAPVENPAEIPTDKLTEETAEPAEHSEPTESAEPADSAESADPAEPAEVPSEVPSEVPAEQPTEELTEEPTKEPIKEPTEEPIEEPSKESTKEPTEEHTPDPIEEPLESSEKSIEEPTENPERQSEEHLEAKSEVKPKEQPEEHKVVPEEMPAEKPEDQPEETLLGKPQKKQMKAELKKLLAKEKPAVRSTVEKEEIKGPYAYLTPYIEGSKVMYPALAEEEVAEPEAIHEAPDDVEAVDEVGDEDTPAGTPAATTSNSPAPEAEVLAVQPPAKKQYHFKQPRPASDLTSLFDDLDSLNEVDLYDRLAAVNHVLVAWQEEWVRLRKIVDDEDNAVKYQAEEAAFQQREKMALSKDPDAMPLRKDYQVKGIRAPKEDSTVLYARQQDRVMAAAYLFEYDDRDSKIGMQDPIGQRRGVGKGRLRDRPKQTAKAAEIDDVNPNVVHGKRTRKPTNLFGDMEATSRSSTPVPTQPTTKRRRGRQNGEENGEPHLSFSSQPEPAVEETPKKRGRGGRPKKTNAPTSIPEDPSTENEAQPDPDEVEERPSRKRRRKVFHDEDYVANDSNEQEVTTGRSARARRHSRLTEVPTGSFYSTTSMPSTQGHDETRPNTSSSTATASTTVSTYGLREKRQKKFSLDEDDGDFEANGDQRKPKRVRRTSKKTQVNDFVDAANHRPEPAQEPTPEPAVSAPKLTKIKIKNFNGNTGSFTTAVPPPPTSHPSNVPVGNGPGPVQLNNAQGAPNGNAAPAHGSEAPKDYGSMTKSEKMSASMKGMMIASTFYFWVFLLTFEIARWASGSMSPAVAKRRATLAAKKAAAKTPIPEFHPGAVFQQHRANHPHPQ